MSRTKSMLRRSNPLRSDMSWVMILAQGVLAAGVGIYALTAEAHAQRNLVLIIGGFLLVNGFLYAAAAFRRDEGNVMAPFHMLRAGVSMTAGLLVVVDRLVGFMSVDAARVVNGVGLLGIGLVTLVGIVMLRDHADRWIGTASSAGLLSIWGIVTLYQVAVGTSATATLGWVALGIGVALIALALVRRTRTPQTTPAPA